MSGVEVVEWRALTDLECGKLSLLSLALLLLLHLDLLDRCRRRMSENTVTPILFVEAVNSYSNFAFVIPFSNPASRRWMHFHGVSPDICCDVWKRLDVVNTMAAEGING
jgi:hypothetical protein